MNLSSDILWQAMCAEWTHTLNHQDVARITQSVEDALGINYESSVSSSDYVPTVDQFAPERKHHTPAKKKKTVSPNESGSLFEQLLTVPQE